MLAPLPPPLLAFRAPETIDWKAEVGNLPGPGLSFFQLECFEATAVSKYIFWGSLRLISSRVGLLAYLVKYLPEHSSQNPY